MPRQECMTKLRVVYDASAKAVGPSLNDCLYAGASLILSHFRLHPVVMAGDIEKTFLMILVKEIFACCLWSLK